LVGVVGVVLAGAALWAGPLTAEERKALEAQLKDLNATGIKLYRAGKVPEAVKAFREGLAVARRLYPAARFPEGRPDLARSLNNLGALLQDQVQYAEAERHLRNALALRRRLYPQADHPDLANSLNSLGALLQSQGKYAEAEQLCRDALAMRRRLYP